MNKNKNTKSDINLKNYQDLDGLTVKKMNFGLWLSENRRRILRFFTIILVVLSAFFFIYSSYYYIIYFITGESDIGLLDNPINYPRTSSEELNIAPVQVLKAGDLIDLAVQLKNVNSNFSASFTYCFIQGDNQEFACGGGFILPSQTKYLLALGQSLKDPNSRPAFKIKDIFWQRVNLHTIPDYSSFSTQRLNFSIQNLIFSNSSRSGLSDKIFLNNLEFDINNQSPFGYYEVPLNILLYSGSELVGVQRYLLNDFLAEEKRHIDISWSGSLPMITKTEVQPDINILDESIYLKYKGASQ